MDALGPLLPALERHARAEWLRVCLSEDDGSLALLIGRVQDREGVDRALVSAGRPQDTVRPLLVEPWGGIETFHPIHTFERVGVVARVLVAVTYDLAPDEAEGYVTFERELTERLKALPGLATSIALQRDGSRNRFVHVAEFRDPESLQTALSLRAADPRFLAARRRLFEGSVAFAHIAGQSLDQAAT